MQTTSEAQRRHPGVPAIVRDESLVDHNRKPLSPGPRHGSAIGSNHPRLDIPPASSIYSQDISPPDSPRTGDGARSSSPNVSPITDGGGSNSRGHTSGSRTFSSSIPLPAQQAAGGTAAYISGWREKISSSQSASKNDSRRTKWDTYSGEPTDSERGKHGQTTPGTAEADKPGMGHSTTITGGQNQSSKQGGLFQNTLRKVGGKKDGGPPPPPPPKEAWKGASGRETILAPVADKPQARTKALPTPSQRRKQQGLKTGQGLRHAFGGRSSPVKEGEEASSPSPIQAIASYARRGTAASASPTEPLESPHENKAAAADEKLAFPPRGDSYQIPPDPTVHQSTPLPPRKDSQQTHMSQIPPSDADVTPGSSPRVAVPYETPQQAPIYAQPKPERGQMSGHMTTAFEQLGIHNEPGSRFSATTYATTIADSPPVSPSLPQEPFNPSILNRKRPVPSAAGSGPRRSIARKATPSEIQLGDEKATPPPPPDAEPVDKVTLLEAKLNSLHKRKANIQTVINELTNVVQPSPGSYDVASRSEIKKTVNGLQVEQAQIAKEIHDTGLQLHRAFKKRDEAATFEPTGLWVHRVTRT